jgi:hypothetical protein
MGSFSHTVHKNYAFVKILSSCIFVLMLINESHGEGCGLEYPYHVAFIFNRFSAKIMHQSKFYLGDIFSLVFVQELHGRIP